MVKSLAFFVALVTCISPAFSQSRLPVPTAGYLNDRARQSPPDSLIAWKARLVSELEKQDNYYECSVMGAGWPSTLWRKADTLGELSSLNEE